LNLPLFRLNLDSDITRGELVGREVLRTDGDGNTVTEFVDGIIPMAMQQPCGLLLDEIDASRPDLGFILQRLTEGKGFMLLEDGGRTIAPHPHFRMFATANTNGRGDESGLYSGTRALGTAFVNRFKPYIEVDYMSEDEEAQLIQEKVPTIEASDARAIAGYATEHRVAFKQADVTLACSPRDTMAFASSVVEYKRCFGDKSDYIGLAFKHSILNAADSDDRQVLDGLANRIFKSGE
jgi:cobaltochelatase CobS